MEVEEKKEGETEPQDEQVMEQQILSDILAEKGRDNIYCLSSTDFQRILK